MSGYLRIRRQRLIQEAEGYLDLIIATSERFPLDECNRHRLGIRTIATLEQLDDAGVCSGRAHFLRGQAYRLIECYDESIDALCLASQSDPANVHIQLALAWCYKRTGRLDRAIEALEDALEFDPERGILHYNLACYWSLTNNVGLTLAHLAKAFELNSEYRGYVGNESDFDPVRNHPEFAALTNVSV